VGGVVYKQKKCTSKGQGEVMVKAHFWAADFSTSGCGIGYEGNKRILEASFVRDLIRRAPLHTRIPTSQSHYLGG
jgi:hypothetical protein